MVDENTIDDLVDKKNALVRELSDVLELLSAARVDMLCDTKLREAVIEHPALDLKGVIARHNKKREALELALDTLERHEEVSEQTKQFTIDSIVDALEES